MYDYEQWKKKQGLSDKETEKEKGAAQSAEGEESKKASEADIARGKGAANVSDAEVGRSTDGLLTTEDALDGTQQSEWYDALLVDIQRAEDVTVPKNADGWWLTISLLMKRADKVFGGGAAAVAEGTGKMRDKVEKDMTQARWSNWWYTGVVKRALSVASGRDGSGRRTDPNADVDYAPKLQSFAPRRWSPGWSENRNPNWLTGYPADPIMSAWDSDLQIVQEDGRPYSLLF